MGLVLVLVGLVACGPTFVSKEEAQKAVEETFAKANPPGRTGMELGGKAVWLTATGFDSACLEQKNLAFNDNPNKRHDSQSEVSRISPTYAAQRYITASTAAGYCLYMGSDPALTIEEMKPDTDKWRVTAKMTLGTRTPWFDCLAPQFTTRFLEVVDAGDHTAALKDPAGVDLFTGTCPHPMPGGEERPKPKARPPQKSPKAPTMAEVQSLVTAFDDALYEHDFQKALAAVSCFNLVEEAPFYGACGVAELMVVGPQPRGEERPEDGAPWLEFAVSSFDDFERIVPDRNDKSIYHVTMTHKRTDRDRSFSVQWVDGKWKLLGVVDSKAEGLSYLRFLYDLHKTERSTIFDKRLKGEMLDEKGNSTDPNAEEDDKKKGTAKK